MNNRWLAMVIVAAAVTGCSGEKAGSEARTAAVAPVVTAAEPVAAVLQSGGTPVAKLGFVLVAKPLVGVQSDLNLEFTAAGAVPALQLQVEADSIAIDSATAKASVAIEAGKTSSHLVKITPQHDGLVEVKVRLRADTDSVETVYVIPLLVTAAGG